MTKFEYTIAALHQVQRERVVVIAQPLGIEVASGIAQAGRPQHPLAGQPLVAEVMHREADALLAHPDRLVDLVQQDRDQRRLPVVAVDDLRTLARLEHELERRLAKEREPADVIVATRTGDRGQRTGRASAAR